MLKQLIRAPSGPVCISKWVVALMGFSVVFLLSTVGIVGMHKVTKEAEFCASCHVMDTVYREWQHSAHRNITNCNDCHTDQRNYATKTWSKVTSGTGHMYHNIFGDHNQMLKLKDKETVQQNCLRCHADVVQGAVLMDDDCFRCHRTTPHGI